MSTQPTPTPEAIALSSHWHELRWESTETHLVSLARLIDQHVATRTAELEAKLAEADNFQEWCYVTIGSDNYDVLRTYLLRLRSAETELAEAVKERDEARESLAVVRSNLAQLDERMTLLIPVQQHIRKDHASMARHNAGQHGMPQGPCQCLICKPTLEEIITLPELEAAESSTQQLTMRCAELEKERDNYRSLYRDEASHKQRIIDAHTVAAHAEHRKNQADIAALRAEVARLKQEATDRAALCERLAEVLAIAWAALKGPGYLSFPVITAALEAYRAATPST